MTENNPENSPQKILSQNQERLLQIIAENGRTIHRIATNLLISSGETLLNTEDLISTDRELRIQKFYQDCLQQRRIILQLTHEIGVLAPLFGSGS